MNRKTQPPIASISPVFSPSKVHSVQVSPVHVHSVTSSYKVPGSIPNTKDTNVHQINTINNGLNEQQLFDLIVKATRYARSEDLQKINTIDNIINKQQLFDLMIKASNQTRNEELKHLVREFMKKKLLILSTGIFIGTIFFQCGLFGLFIGVIIGIFIAGNPNESNAILSLIDSVKTVAKPVLLQRLMSN